MKTTERGRCMHTHPNITTQEQFTFVTTYTISIYGLLFGLTHIQYVCGFSPQGLSFNPRWISEIRGGRNGTEADFSQELFAPADTNYYSANASF